MNITVAGIRNVETRPQGIKWAPISSNVDLHFNGTSFTEVELNLAEGFGGFPIRLSKKEHAETLRGMMIGAGQGETPYKELLAALDRFGQLEVILA